MCNSELKALVETFLDKSFKFTNHFPVSQVYQAYSLKLTHHERGSGGVTVIAKMHFMKCAQNIKTALDHIICLKLEATRGVMVSTSAFIACHQCYSAGPSLGWDLKFSGLSLWHILKLVRGFFSGHSGFLPSSFE